ncbi:MAG: FAD:protein FMN transferase [Planctomycetota bacterium]
MLRFGHRAMACDWELYLPVDDRAYGEQAARAAFEEVDRLEEELSRFVPTSDIARIPSLRAGESLRIGADTRECLEIAEEVRAHTGGAFDVAFRTRLDAAGAEEDRARAVLEIDSAARSVRAGVDGPIVDLGGIGKGFAIDRAMSIVRDWGFEAALLHGGQSSLLALGAPPRHEGWLLDIRDPRDPSKALGRVRLRDRALSGSGVLTRGRHIVDPRSGQAAAGGAGAWAETPAAALSDALSTAFLLLAPEEVAACCSGHPGTGALLPAVAEEGDTRLLAFGDTGLLDE